MTLIKRPGTFAAVGILLACGAAAVHAKTFSLSKILDTGGQFSSIGGVSINNDGTLAFTAQLDGGGEGIFSYDGQSLHTIADTNGEFSSLNWLRINAAGEVAFLANYDVGFPAGGQTIFVGDGQTPTPIVNTSGSFFQFGLPMLNDAGDIVVRGQLDNGNWGIFRVRGGVVTTIADQSGPFDQISMSYFENVPSIDDDGTVAFSGWLDAGPRGIFVGSGGPPTPVVDDTGLFGSFGWVPFINNGSVLFSATLDDGTSGLFLKNGTETSLVAESSAAAFGFFNGVFNGSGDVAFAACFLDQDGCAEIGIMTGSDPTADTLVREGGLLFGATVESVGSVFGLNESGQIAFSFELDNGLSGIAVATPVPEPSGLCLIVTAMAIGASRHTISRRVAALRPGRRRRPPGRCSAP
jgi:hypothetical protein